MSRILIVEDDISLAGVVRSLLELEAHTVDHQITGDAGLDAALSGPYDLLILDWELPGLHGIDILSRFRQSGACTPVLILTGKDSAEDKEIGLERGADDYLTKPFNLKELKARVRALLRRSLVNSSQNLKLGNIEIDCLNKRATKGGRTFVLPQEEFLLLEFAARYPHLKPDLGSLLAMAWPPDGGKGEADVAQTIQQLRKKLDPSASLVFSHLLKDSPKEAESNAFAGKLDRANFNHDMYIGTIFNGKYEIVELIGDGASGLVFRSKHIDLGTEVALKILHLNTLAHPETVPRFTREARTTAQLSHPNIVALRDFGLGDREQPYIVMELLDGTTLSELIYKLGPPPVIETLKIFRQVCAGLAYAHEKGLVHRDIKPSNLILVDDGQSGMLVKIVDFGLARGTSVDEQMGQITETGVVVGSPPYMSPEQCRGEELDKRSDLYSTGCALYETFQGQVPFGGKSAVEMLVKHLRSNAPEVILEATPPVVQIRINKIIARCLAKDRENRFQSATELGQALDEIIGMHGGSPDIEESQRPDTSSQPWAQRKDLALKWLAQKIGAGRKQNQVGDRP